MTLEFNRFEDGAAFLHAAEDHLLRNEAENGLTLGVAALTTPPSSDNLWATVTAGGQVVGTAFHTPPYKIVITAASDEVIDLVAGRVSDEGRTPPGVLGPSRSAGRFAAAWSSLTNSAATPGLQQRIYRLDRVVPPASTTGELRPARREDLDLLAEWYEAFSEETGTLRPQSGHRVAESGIWTGQLFVWDDGRPVSMAAWSRPTRNGVTISAVYTPGEHRSRGYASAAVAALSQRLLDEGRRFCALYTDQANLTANDIYMSIGYAPVCDVAEYVFD